MEQASYNRKEILEAVRDRFDGRPASSYYVSVYTLVHRFIKLSDGFCQLINSGNALSAQALLRPMFDCVMRLFIDSAFDDEQLGLKALNGESFDKIWVQTLWPEDFPNIKKGDQVSLSDGNIIRFMKRFGLENIDEFYKKICKYTHFSEYHYADLFKSEDSISIGGDDTELQAPIFKDALDDFDFVQKLFLRTLNLC